MRSAAILFALIALFAKPAAGVVEIQRLRCEYLENPPAIDATSPRLSWILKSDRRSEMQTAYQICVASSPEELAKDHGDEWDSGKVASSKTAQVEYAGKPLVSCRPYFWKVRVWDAAGQPSGWSSPARWSMGLLNPQDWHGQWIGIEESIEAKQLASPRYLRKPFTVSGDVRRATIYATALGLYELRLDGKRVGDHLLAPEWTSYQKRVQYQAYDVTAMLASGRHCIAAQLGNGWYSGLWQDWPPKCHIYGDQPYLMAQLEIEYADGHTDLIASDKTWRGTNDGPIRFAGLYEGETYDAQREFPGWDTPDFDDSKWTPAHVGEGLNVGALVAQRSEPIRVTQDLPAIAVTEPKPGIYVFDLGQNMVGWCRIKLDEPAGTTVTLLHNEMLNPDGTVYMDNLHAGHFVKGDRQVVRYSCRGGGESYEPHFTSMGFRYVEVHGLTKKPTAEMLTGRVFHTDFRKVGTFTCSNPLVNRLVENIQWSQRGNMTGVPTDCPSRDERCGYTGDAQFFMPTAVYNFDVAAFFNKWLVDVCEDAQRPEGYFADHAPDFGAGKKENVGWSDAGIICPYEIYQTYGDTRMIRDHYAAMKRYMELIDRTSTDFLRDPKRVGNGDWLNLHGGASAEVIGTAYAAFNYHLMAEMAAAIGEPADADRFAQQSQKIADAFAAKYIQPDGQILASSQTGFALAFTMGLVPPSMKDSMSKAFAAEIEKHDNHIASGFIGTPRLLPALHLADRDDLAYMLLLNETYPSWLYQVKLGATTMWERWNGWTPEKGFASSGMNSFNHYAFGSVGQYLFETIAGIQPAAPGYDKIYIRPVPGDGLTSASATYECIHGRIASAWEKRETGLILAVSVPANTTASLTIPAASDQQVSEGGLALEKAPGISSVKRESKAVLCELGSGDYRFEVTKAP